MRDPRRDGARARAAAAAPRPAGAGGGEPEGEPPVVPWRAPPDQVAAGKFGSVLDLARFRQWAVAVGGGSSGEWRWRELVRRARRLDFKRRCFGHLGLHLRAVRAAGRED